MKFSTVFFSAIFAATALAAPGPVPDLAPAPAPEAIALLRRNAEAAISAAENYRRAIEARDSAIGASLNSTNSTLGEDEVNIFCRYGSKKRDVSAATALAAADTLVAYAKSLA